MSIGNPNDWNYEERTLNASLALRFDDALLQKLVASGAARTVSLPIGKNQGKGCVIIQNDGASNNININAANIDNESATIPLGPEDAVRLDYFSNSDPTKDGFWIASTAIYNT